MRSATRFKAWSSYSAEARVMLTTGTSSASIGVTVAASVCAGRCGRSCSTLSYTRTRAASLGTPTSNSTCTEARELLAVP